MIISRTPLALAHVRGYTRDLDQNKPIVSYLKKFCVVSAADAEKRAAEIKALKNPKIKEENIVKILDLLPQDAEDLHKIFVEVTLTEEEAAAILACIAKS